MKYSQKNETHENSPADPASIKPDVPVYGDQPITTPGDDIFGRTAFAKNLAQALANMPGPEPFVFGLSGPWGSGKTSLLNLVEHELTQNPDVKEKITVFRFNPWWFSGSDELLLSFLHEFAKALGMSARGETSQALAKYLTTFGHLLKPAKFIPGFNVPFETLATLADSGGAALKAAGEMATQDAVSIRREIDSLLLKRALPVLVVIDDVDRLHPDEVIQIFRIVKAVADFPYVRYIMAYDDGKVCSTIKASMGIEGREFLEKIIQMPIELPSISQNQLHRMFLTGLEAIAKDTPQQMIDRTRFGNVFHDGISPFLTSPRVIKRLLNVLRVSYPSLKGEVDVADFVAIQALMVFAPDIHRFVRKEPEWFIQTRDDGMEEAKRAFRDRWQSLCPENIRESVTRLLQRTFPRFETLMGGPGYSDGFESQWSARAQVASERHFSKYFQLILDEGRVTQTDLAALLDIVDNAEATDAWFESQLDRCGPNDNGSRVAEALTVLHDVAQSCKTVTTQQKVSLLQSLLRIGDRLRKVPDTDYVVAMFPITNRLRLIWLLRSLIEGIKNDQERADQTLSAFTNGSAVVTMLDLARNLGTDHGLYGSDKDHGDSALVEKDTALKCANIGVELTRVKAAKDELDASGNIWELARLWSTLGEKNEVVNWLRSICERDDVLLDVVEESVSEGHSWGMGGFGSMGDRVARTELKIPVEYLCSFFDPVKLRERAAKLLSNEDMMNKASKKASFGLREICNRIQDDGSITPRPDLIGDEDE